MSGDNASKKRSLGAWLAWWKIDPAELDKQVSQYDSLRVTKSMRGISVLCLAFSMMVTVIFAFFGAFGLDASGYFDAGMMAVLAVFIYLGHRWAMLAAMVLWTAEKVLIVAGGLGTTHVSGGLVIAQFFWWCAYMHAFYFAFRIEGARRTLA